MTTEKADLEEGRLLVKRLSALGFSQEEIHSNLVVRGVSKEDATLLIAELERTTEPLAVKDPTPGQLLGRLFIAALMWIAFVAFALFAGVFLYLRGGGDSFMFLLIWLSPIPFFYWALIPVIRGAKAADGKKDA